jgi:hypothetical protein
MEQRIYRGNLTTDELADYLVQQFDPQENLQAQKIGQGESLVVQIGRGDVPKELRHAVSVAITAVPQGEPGAVVTMGQQQWLTPNMATYAAMMGLIGLLVTPWALFGLLWPVTDLIGSQTLPGQIWDTIELYAASKGVILQQKQELSHPHAG